MLLQAPQTRDGSFSTDIFKRYQRSEQAFALALMEMVAQGVSTCKVAAITEELCGASFSQSTFSQLCVGLDARVRAFNERGLSGVHYLVSDSHGGIARPMDKNFQGASWQRCQERKYLDRHEFREWLAERNKPADSAKLVAISTQ